jgi:hypothetical protein
MMPSNECFYGCNNPPPSFICSKISSELEALQDMSLIDERPLICS